MIEKVTGLVVGKNGVTLFLGDGQVQVFAQDSYRTKDIVDAVMPKLGRGEHPEIDLSQFSLEKKVEQMLGVNSNIKIETKPDGEVAIQMGNQKLKGAGLRKIVEQTVYNNNPKALKNFLANFAVVAKRRQHSSDDLLKFLQGTDLPIADDGSMIGYKILNAPDADDYMTDCHTRQVRQKVGSLVFMPESKVDEARVACSTGLHICSKNYIRSYYGDGCAITLVKFSPSDAIAVPHETSKIRVARYHVVAILPREEAIRLRDTGVKIEDLPESAKILQDVIAGNHVGILETVEVGREKASNYTSVAAKITTKSIAQKAKPKKKKATRALPKPIEKQSVSVVEVKKNAKNLAVEAAKRGDLASAINSAPNMTPNTAYAKKLAQAVKLHKGGKGLSIRAIAKKLKMDRESLAKNLKRA
jgi:hypothetical protein